VQNRYKLYFLIAAFITILVVAGIVVRNKRQRQLQDMRNSIADDLHDDIGSALSASASWSELAKAGHRSSAPARFYRRKHPFVTENMSDIVWTVNPKERPLRERLQRNEPVRFGDLDAKNIELDFGSDATLSGTRRDGTTRISIFFLKRPSITRQNIRKRQGIRWPSLRRPVY